MIYDYNLPNGNKDPKPVIKTVVFQTTLSFYLLLIKVGINFVSKIFFGHTILFVNHILPNQLGQPFLGVDIAVFGALHQQQVVKFNLHIEIEFF